MYPGSILNESLSGEQLNFLFMQNRRYSDLVTFTEEIHKVKLHFFVQCKHPLFFTQIKTSTALQLAPFF